MNSELLSLVLDELIPTTSDGRLPGAGTLGVGAVVEHAVAGTPELGQMLAQGFAALEGLAQRRSPDGFGALSRSARVETLRDLEKAAPMFVLTALNGDARPPHPRGYEVEADDFSMLDGVRSRGVLYRNC